MRILTSISTLALWTALAAQPALAQSSDYSFTPPDVPREVGGQVFQYFLPAVDGFAANINLQIQPFEGDMQSYMDISEAQFQQLGFEVIDVSQSPDELIYQYQGSMQGGGYRWYSRVLKDGNYYYVLTATALAERWDTERDQLIDAVHSFQLNR